MQGSIIGKSGSAGIGGMNAGSGKKGLITAGIFVAFQALFLIVFIIVWQVYSGTTIQDNIRQDTDIGVNVENTAQADFWMLANDIIGLSENVRVWLAEGRDLSNISEEMRTQFLWMSRHKEFYDQIRILDANGVEQLRINQSRLGPVVVGANQLQDKSTSGYYVQGRELQTSQFMLSSIELNRDRGVVERPLKPVVRGTTPIRNLQTGELLGLVVINMDARPLLEKIKASFGQSGGSIQLLNSDGEWMLSPDETNQWSLQVAEGANFAETYPEVWQAILTGDLTGEEIANMNVVSKTITTSPGASSKALEGIRPILDITGQEFIAPFYTVALITSPGAFEIIASAPGLSAGIFGIYALITLIISFYIGHLLSARREVMQEIENRSKFQEAITNTMVDALITINRVGIVLSINGAGQRMFGYTAEEMIGNNIKMLMQGDTRKEHDGYLSKYRETGEGSIIGRGPREVQGFTKDGDQLDLELAVSPSKLEGEDIYVGSLRDLTEKKRILEESNAELEKFAYVASHDLRAPLRAIDNLSQWIEEDIKDVMKEDTKKNMNLLRGRVNRLEMLLDDILQYSRAGRVVERTTRIDVGEAVMDVKSFLNIPKGFDVKTKGKMPKVLAPKGALEQIFNNLMTNALKHHDKKSGKIVVSAKDLGEKWQFAVEDDGPGIPHEFQEKIFGMFQKLEGRDKAEGSGMGLAIIKKLVSTHGGKVWLESSGKKRGTTFFFTWPKIDASLDNA